MHIKRIGLDIAKHVFQIHGVDRFEKVLVRKQLRRVQVLDYFKSIAPCLIGIEACGSSHYWARELSQLGHQVKLIPAQFVKPFVKGRKNDAMHCAACDVLISKSI
jgi:transposase